MPPSSARCDFHIEMMVGARGVAAGVRTALVETVLPVLDRLSILARTACYFDVIDIGGSERIRLSFADPDDGMRVLDALKQLARRSGTPAPYRVLHSPSTMLSELISGPEAAPVFERFSRRAAPDLFAWHGELAGGQRKTLSLAFDLLALHIITRDPGSDGPSSRDAPRLPRAFLSYRSHADGFIVMSRHPEATRLALEERYRSIAETAGRRFLRLQEMVDADALPADLSRWREGMRMLLVESRAAIDEGAVYFARGTGYLGDQNDLSQSQFQQTINGSLGFQVFMRSNPAFLASRLSTGLLYLTLRRLGLPILDRYFLCHAIARAVEDRFNVDPVVELRRLLVETLTPRWGRYFLPPLLHLAVRYIPQI